MALSLGNIINVSLTQSMKGLSDINTSVLALFTDEEPIPNDYGDHRVYLDPVGVARDFGTDSKTARLANMIFAQSANIITGGGYLVVIPRIADNSAQPATILASGVDLTELPESGSALNIAVNGSANRIVFDNLDSSSLESLQSSLNAAAQSVGITFSLIGELGSADIMVTTTATGTNAAINVTPAEEQLIDAAPLLGIAGLTASGTNAGLESVKDAIIRTADSIQYFGIITTEAYTDDTVKGIAGIVQALPKIFFAASSAPAVIGGVFKDITNASQTHTRCLFYSLSVNQALDFAAGYASRGLSCNFSGSNTTFTMHLKDIAGLVPDTIDQTTLQNCKNNGIDVYADFGIVKVYTSGANMFYDQVYNRLALQLRVQIALFNFLATTNTKIPQTEEGMSAMKSTVRDVFIQFVVNGMLAPGEWKSAATIGDPEAHRRNIRDFGFFVYSQPLAQQSQTERESRKAPVIQSAAKEAGAIHSGDLIINVEA